MIILTKTFKKNFLSIFKNKVFLDSFCETLTEKCHTLIDLKYPYKKCKFDIQYIAVRGILLITKDSDIVPLFVVKKKDKKLGNNLILDKKTMEYIETLLPKILGDIQAGDFEKIG